VKTLLRHLGRTILWPLRRFFDPRFKGLANQLAEATQALLVQIETARGELSGEIRAHHAEILVALDELRAQIQELHWLVRIDADAANDATSILGRTLNELDEAVGEIRNKVAVLSEISDDNPTDATTPRGTKSHRR
jgi:hypothetical protein